MHIRSPFQHIDNGKYTHTKITTTIHINMGEKVIRPKILPIDIIPFTLIAFDYLDAYFDFKYPDFINEYFTTKEKKYLQLTAGKSFENILARIYQKLCQIRNSINHNKFKVDKIKNNKTIEIFLKKDSDESITYTFIQLYNLSCIVIFLLHKQNENLSHAEKCYIFTIFKEFNLDTNIPLLNTKYIVNIRVPSVDNEARLLGTFTDPVILTDKIRKYAKELPHENPDGSIKNIIYMDLKLTVQNKHILIVQELLNDYPDITFEEFFEYHAE